MKELLIGAGIGFVLGITLVKTCKEVNDAANKTKKMIQNKVEEMKK